MNFLTRLPFGALRAPAARTDVCPRRPRAAGFQGSALAILVGILGWVAPARAWEEVRYANDAAQLQRGARLPALAGVVLGLPIDPGGVGFSPAGLAEFQDPELVVHHAVLHSGLGATQDELLLAVPLQNQSGLGVSVTRIGVDGIRRVGEDEVPDFENPTTFNATDWVATLALGRAWMSGRLLAGGALQVLLRDLDQMGIGAQTDASVVWRDPRGWRAGARLARGFGSFASWMETGREEFSPADVVVGAGLERKLPYFYGKGFLGWESPGLIQGEASASFTDQDVRPTTDPWLALRASRLAGEFVFDFGGVVRAGCEVQALTRLTDFLQAKDEEGLFGESRGLLAFGAGYLWNQRARVDYAMVLDPDLGASHRVALGLIFGTGTGAGQAARAAPSGPAPREEIPPPEKESSPPRADSLGLAPELPPEQALPPETESPVTRDSSRAPALESAGAAPESGSVVPPASAPSAPSKPVAAPPPPESASEDSWDAPERAQ